MFADALAAYRARQAELNRETARATAAVRRAAQELAAATAREQNAGAEAVFHTQERLGSELRAVRKEAAAADRDVATLTKARGGAAAGHRLAQRQMAPGPPLEAAGALKAAYDALAVSRHGSRQLRAACPRLFRDLLAVLSGLRPAFMLDYGQLPAEQLAAAAASLAAALQLQAAAAQCCVAVLGDCCYVVRPQALPAVGDSARSGQQQQGSPAAAPPVLFLAFDGPRPRWSSAAEASEAAAALQALRAGLLAAVARHQQEQDWRTAGSSRSNSSASAAACPPLPVVQGEDLPGWQQVVPPTASGYLLGYPAVYLCHSLEGAQAASRGLSSGSLCLHTVAATLAAPPPGVPQPLDQPLLGFSVPAELAGVPEWAACRDAWWAALEERVRSLSLRRLPARRRPSAVRLEKCWFCSSTIYPGHGITFVRNDATIFRFCRSKCHKNFKMKRNPRKVKWTKAYRKLAGKELAEDATFEMERRRNRPEKYDRELVHKTVKAIKKVDAIRTARQDRFYEARMSKAKKQAAAADRRQLEQEIHLVKAPGALAKEREEKLKVAVEESQQDMQE
ncbi:hypothetical protein ABPG75_006108 [Micractinium tetrahymenae]